jgi:hypothetical protein
MLAAAALALAGCLAPAPEPDDWLAFGYGGPEATVRSFLTALAGDRPDLEYLCLSRGLKDREGGNLLGYLVFRDELRRSHPWLKAAARAEIESVEHPAPGRARVHARVDWLFWDESFVVDLVAAGFYEYRSGAELLEDGYFDFAPVARDGAVVLALPAPEEAELGDATAIGAGTEWKIDALTLPNP